MNIRGFKVNDLDKSEAIASCDYLINLNLETKRFFQCGYGSCTKCVLFGGYYQDKNYRCSLKESVAEHLSVLERIKAIYECDEIEL